MNDVGLAILAGGKSSRMGTDKLGLRLADGTLMVARWLANVAWPGPTALVLPVGGRAPDGLRVDCQVFDAVPDEGPLRGVLSVLEQTAHAWTLFVPVDMPGVGRAQLDWLLNARAAHANKTLFCMRRTRDDRPMIEPLPMMIHQSLREIVAARLAGGRRALHGLADEPGAIVLDVPKEWPDTVWRNLNRPGDLEAFLSKP